MKINVADIAQTFRDKFGRAAVPAYTVTSYDAAADFTYWIVNLHEFTPAPGAEVAIMIFDDQGEAERYAAAAREGKKLH